MHPNASRLKRTAVRLNAEEPLWLKAILIVSAVLITTWIIIVPVVYVFVQAMSEGWEALRANLLDDEDTLHAIWLTFTVAPIAVMVNTLCGIAAAWCLTKFQFPGRTLLITMLDLPFAVSPVVAGLCFVLIFGLQGYLGEFLRDHGMKIIFAWPGLVLATTFVTIPFVARELIPLMQALGSDEELAAVSLGASPWQMFWRVTLPNIKWALLFGMIQCNARAIGEFGAVYVVSGHIAGESDTMPLRVEKLYQEYNNPGAFAVAAVLTLIALATLVLKLILEYWSQRSVNAATTEGATP